MVRSWFNHISIKADNMEESERFYTRLFDAKVLPMPNMGVGVEGRWLSLGDQQLHLFGAIKPGGDPLNEAITEHRHFAITVENFEKLYHLVHETGAQEDHGVWWGHPLNIMPSGQVQYYIRDPAGNLVEVNIPDASVLPEEILKRANYQELRFEQSDEQRKATLSLGHRSDKGEV